MTRHTTARNNGPSNLRFFKELHSKALTKSITHFIDLFDIYQCFNNLIKIHEDESRANRFSS